MNNKNNSKQTAPLYHLQLGAYLFSMSEPRDAAALLVTKGITCSLWAAADVTDAGSGVTEEDIGVENE